MIKEQVAEWLRTLPGTSDVSPITLTIDEQTWEGAAYTQGGKKGLYLIGDRPRHTNTCFRFTGDGTDWYMSAYLANPVYLSKRRKKFHPFGKNWMMRPWTCKTKIDAHTKYHRQDVVIT